MTLWLAVKECNLNPAGLSIIRKRIQSWYQSTVETTVEMKLMMYLCLHNFSVVGNILSRVHITYIQGWMQVLFTWQDYLTFSYYFICDRIVCILVTFYQWGHFVMLDIMNLNLISVQSWNYRFTWEIVFRVVWSQTTFYIFSFQRMQKLL